MCEGVRENAGYRINSSASMKNECLSAYSERGGLRFFFFGGGGALKTKFIGLCLMCFLSLLISRGLHYYSFNCLQNIIFAILSVLHIFSCHL